MRDARTCWARDETRAKRRERPAEAMLVERFAQTGLGPQGSTAELRSGQLEEIGIVLSAVLEEIGAPQPSASASRASLDAPRGYTR